MYELTRDDGAVLRLSDYLWEAALDLAFRCGWKPAGTEPPRGSREPGRPTPIWDAKDYFSRERQRVGAIDAERLASAVLRAVSRVEARTARPAGAARLEPSEERSRGPEIATRSWNTMSPALNRFVVFAHKGGFTIGWPTEAGSA